MKSLIKDLIDVIVGVIVITFILIYFILMPVKVDGESMYPTLHDDNFGYSFIITKNLGLNRFDIAVIKVDNKLLVKRIIGLPGEYIEYIDGKLYINGEYIKEDFLVNDIKTCSNISCYLNDEDNFSIQLNDDEYFCLGDNRERSRDSRFYGPFKKENIKSTNILILWPLNNFGFK